MHVPLEHGSVPLFIQFVDLKNTALFHMFVWLWISYSISHRREIGSVCLMFFSGSFENMVVWERTSSLHYSVEIICLQENSLTRNLGSKFLCSSCFVLSWKILRKTHLQRTVLTSRMFPGLFAAHLCNPKEAQSVLVNCHWVTEVNFTCPVPMYAANSVT